MTDRLIMDLYLKIISYIFKFLVRTTITSWAKSTDTSTMLGPFMRPETIISIRINLLESSDRVNESGNKINTYALLSPVLLGQKVFIRLYKVELALRITVPMVVELLLLSQPVDDNSPPVLEKK